MWEKIRNVLTFILILGVLLGVIFAQSYSHEARLINHPELNCPNGWIFVENEIVQMCVRTKMAGDTIGIITVSDMRDSSEGSARVMRVYDRRELE